MDKSSRDNLADAAYNYLNYLQDTIENIKDKAKESRESCIKLTNQYQDEGAEIQKHTIDGYFDLQKNILNSLEFYLKVNPLIDRSLVDIYINNIKKLGDVYANRFLR